TPRSGQACASSPCAPLLVGRIMTGPGPSALTDDVGEGLPQGLALGRGQVERVDREPDLVDELAVEPVSVEALVREVLGEDALARFAHARLEARRLGRLEAGDLRRALRPARREDARFFLRELERLARAIPAGLAR